MKTNFMGKCYAGMDGMVKGMKRTNLNWKQDGKAAEAEKTIHTMTREIGNLTVVMLDGDRSVGPDIKERYAAILEARKLMAEAEAGKKHTKNACPHCGTFGSWLFKEGLPYWVSIAGAIIAREFAFEELGKEKEVEADGTHEDNKGVISFSRMLGMNFDGFKMDDKGKYLTGYMLKGDFEKNKQRFIRTFPVK